MWTEKNLVYDTGVETPQKKKNGWRNSWQSIPEIEKD